MFYSSIFFTSRERCEGAQMMTEHMVMDRICKSLVLVQSSFKKKMRKITWWHTACKINSSQYRSVSLFNKVKRNLSKWSYEETTHNKWIVVNRVLFEYIVQLLSKLYPWSHYQTIYVKAKVRRKVLFEYMTQFERKFPEWWDDKMIHNKWIALINVLFEYIAGLRRNTQR